jgi:hypothetical protein
VGVGVGGGGAVQVWDVARGVRLASWDRSLPTAAGAVARGDDGEVVVFVAEAKKTAGRVFAWRTGVLRDGESTATPTSTTSEQPSVAQAHGAGRIVSLAHHSACGLVSHSPGLTVVTATPFCRAGANSQQQQQQQQQQRRLVTPKSQSSSVGFKPKKASSASVVRGVGVNAAGTRVCVGDDDGAVHVFDLAANTANTAGGGGGGGRGGSSAETPTPARLEIDRRGAATIVGSMFVPATVLGEPVANEDIDFDAAEDIGVLAASDGYVWRWGPVLQSVLDASNGTPV